MQYADLVDAVESGGAFPNHDEARHALDATLEVLGRHLDPIDLEVLTPKLPPEALAQLKRDGYQGDVEREQFYREVREHTRAPAGRAVEHAQLACHALAHAMDAEGRRHLTLHLHPSMHELFEPAPASEPAPPGRARGRHVPPGSGHTLASGRVGSRHPLSEAAPHGHQHSVAESDDPHADTRLSSARGTSQERRGDTLASGIPGSKRPLSESED